MKNILYFMHVPWGWIKQRPHFIAEGLAEKNKVLVAYEKPYRTRHLVDNVTGLNLFPIPRLPIKKSSFFNFINIYLIARQLENKCKKNNVDILWVTDIRLFTYLRRMNLAGVKVIYDCMDETLEFAYLLKSIQLKRELEKDEIDLIKMCEHVFCSSETLMRRLVERTGVDKRKLSVINNALDVRSDKSVIANNTSELDAVISRIKDNGFVVVTYVGTISEWFDIQSVCESLSANAKIFYLLVGPAEISLPKHDRLLYLGAVEHCYVDYILGESDILVMPFKLNRLIESVDPVKIYEYVRSAKEIVVPDYDEMNKFSEYVFTFKSCDEYVGLINDIVKGKSLGYKNSVESFVERNSWDSRSAQIQQCIDAL